MGVLKSARNFSLGVLGILFAIFVLPFILVIAAINKIANDIIDKIGFNSFLCFTACAIILILLIAFNFLPNTSKKIPFRCKRKRPSDSVNGCTILEMAVFNKDDLLCFILQDSGLSNYEAKNYFSEFLNTDKGKFDERKISEYRRDFLLTITDPELSISFDTESPILLCKSPEKFSFSAKAENKKLLISSNKNQFKDLKHAKKIFEEYFKLKDISLTEKQNSYEISFLSSKS